MADTSRVSSKLTQRAIVGALVAAAIGCALAAYFVSKHQLDNSRTDRVDTAQRGIADALRRRELSARPLFRYPFMTMRVLAGIYDQALLAGAGGHDVAVGGEGAGRESGNEHGRLLPGGRGGPGRGVRTGYR